MNKWHWQEKEEATMTIFYDNVKTKLFSDRAFRYATRLDIFVIFRKNM